MTCQRQKFTKGVFGVKPFALTEKRRTVRRIAEI